MMNPYEQIGVVSTELLLPAPEVNPVTWAVLASDKHASEPAWWAETRLEVGNATSTLQLVLPDCDLPQAAQRIPVIHQTMERYLSEGVLRQAVADGMMLTERYTAFGARVGLVCAVDLEQYDAAPGSSAPVRPAEEIMPQWLTARMQLRQGAALETSHVVLMMDDPMETVVEPLYERRDSLRLCYDFPLMRGGGHLRGWAVDSPEDKAAVFQALAALRMQQTQQGAPLFAVGDGNHSLAAAKACWEALKKTLTPAQAAVHPARYALAEIENIHDDVLTFEPIHRLLSGMNGNALMQDWTYYCELHQMDLSEVTEQGDTEQSMRVLYGGNEVLAAISKPEAGVAVRTLQCYLDDLMKRVPGLRLDFIHGEEQLRSLCGSDMDQVGFLMPGLSKQDFFPALAQAGMFPQKSFSMGDAHEKRYYMECRRIR